jgi:DNA-binding NarL/FixJ family response regulator
LDRHDFVLDVDMSRIDGDDVMPDRITVVLVDDCELIRQGLKQILSRDASIAVAGEASGSCEAIPLIARLQPNVVILDVRLCTGSGIEVSRAIEELAPHTKILVLTACDDLRYVAFLARLGINSYLIKTCSAEELIGAIHYAAKGWLVFSPEIGDRLASVLRKNIASLSYSVWAHPDSSDEPTLLQKAGRDLTTRETEVLEQMCHGLKNGDIADNMGIAQKTVEVHIHRIFLKLGAKNRTQAVVNLLRRQ